MYKEIITAVFTIGLSASVMADFDRNDPDDLLALHEEVVNDPIGMEYDAICAGQTVCYLDLFNNPEKNLGGEVVPQELTPELLLSVLTPEDVKIMQTSEMEFFKLYVSRDFGTDLEPFRNQILSVLPARTGTIDSLPDRRVSRAEVLFGAGTYISRDDWIAARDYTP